MPCVAREIESLPPGAASVRFPDIAFRARIESVRDDFF